MIGIWDAFGVFQAGKERKEKKERREEARGRREAIRKEEAKIQKRKDETFQESERVKVLKGRMHDEKKRKDKKNHDDAIAREGDGASESPANASNSSVYEEPHIGLKPTVDRSPNAKKAR